MSDYKQLLNECKNHKNKTSEYKVSKPWGEEHWLEVNDFYVLKKIIMKKGYKCSLQKHITKVETNYMLSGEAKVTIDNETVIFKAGDSWSIYPGQVHRVEALEDYVALEASSPHLDDIIRLEDDANRGDGKIEDEHKNLYISSR